jgi:hypothetical protein
MHDNDRKRQSEGVTRRKQTVIKKIHEIGKIPGIEVAFIICHNGRYTTYLSVDRPGWPPSIEQIVRRPRGAHR